MQNIFQKLLLISAAAASLTAVSTPAAAVMLVPGATLVVPESFAPLAATQGVLQASSSFSDLALTFGATFREAVYLNTLGTLDFYFQISHTGEGSLGLNQEIAQFTAASFENYLVDGFAWASDPDGAGIFLAPSGFTDADTTFGRSSPAGRVIQVDFGDTGLSEGQTSSTYIFRTNATAYNREGTFGIIDGSTLAGSSFQPVAAAIPEPAMWGMLVFGFGAVGATMRRRTSIQQVSA